MVRRALVLKPPRLPLQARSREKRARVLAAVLVLLDELGYGATTIEAVAQWAEIPVELAYRYFHVKAQIVHTLVQERMDEVLLQVELLGQGVLALETIAGIFRHLDEDQR